MPNEEYAEVRDLFAAVLRDVAESPHSTWCRECRASDNADL